MRKTIFSLLFIVLGALCNAQTTDLAAPGINEVTNKALRNNSSEKADQCAFTASDLDSCQGCSDKYCSKRALMNAPYQTFKNHGEVSCAAVSNIASAVSTCIGEAQGICRGRFYHPSKAKVNAPKSDHTAK